MENSGVGAPVDSGDGAEQLEFAERVKQQVDQSPSEPQIAVEDVKRPVIERAAAI